MQRVRASQLELTLQVRESDVEVDHGHFGRGMAEHLHQCGEVHTAAKHLGGIGMSELMRDDASRKAGSGTDFIQIRAELANERVSGSGPRQQTAIGGRGIQRAEKAQTLDQIASEGIDRDHTFGFQLAEGYVNPPLIGAGGVEAIEGEIGGFADAHAGVAEQEEEVGAEIVAA